MTILVAKHATKPNQTKHIDIFKKPEEVFFKYRVGTKFGNERFVVYPENQWSNLLQIFFTN